MGLPVTGGSLTPLESDQRVQHLTEVLTFVTYLRHVYTNPGISVYSTYLFILTCFTPEPVIFTKLNHSSALAFTKLNLFYT